MPATELFTALTLGLIGGLIPGPVITAIFTELLQAGPARALRIVFIALGVESLVALLSLLAFTFLGVNEDVFRILSFAGAGVLTWIAISIWKVQSLDPHNRVHFSFGKLILMILSNGVLWTYWITICIPKAMFLKESIVFGQYLFMGLVQLGWLLSTLALTYLFSRFRKILSAPRVIPIAFKVFSLLFLYFAIDMVVDSIKYFLDK